MPVSRWTKLESLFVTATELPPEARARFIERECGDDAEMRAELLSLLRYDTVSQPEIEAALGAGAAWIVDGEKLEGRVLGAYRIEREIGRGGMSVVYLASRDDGEFRKDVAIKLIKRGMDTDAVVSRLRRERGILAALEHPYIARLLDGGTTPDGRPYIVMDHVDGLPIDRYCAERAFDPMAVCGLIEKVCEAVSYAHRSLVVHRDLKPANILIASDGTPRLLDFGIARLLEGDQTGDAAPETRGLFQAFTPEYASPEQLSGAGAGTGADVYSLGVILFELLVGTRPYGSETAACGREAERASTVAARNRLPERRVKQLRGDLDNILAKALHRDVDRRYLSVEQLQLDLFRYRSSLPVAARGDSVLYRTGKLFVRHRFASVAAIVAVLAVTAGIVATLAQSRAAQAARQVAEARRIEADQERQRAEDSARQSALARERAEAEHAEAEAQRNVAELQKVAAETQRAVAERRFGELHQLAKTFTIDFDNAITPLAGSLPARKLLVETGLQYYDSLLKDAAGNKALLEEIANAYDHLGDAEGNPGFSNLGDRGAALKAFEKAKAIRSGISDDSPQFVANRLENSFRMGLMLVQKGDLAEATVETAGALRLAETSPARDDPKVRLAVLRLWGTLGDVKNQADDFEPALDAYGHLLELSSGAEAAGVSSVDARSMISLAHTKLGEVLAQMGRGPEALQHLRVALAMDEEFQAKEPNSVPRLRKISIDYYMINWALASPSGAATATQEETRLSIEKAAEISDRIAAVDTGNITAQFDAALARLNYANWYRGRGDYANALAEIQKYYGATKRWVQGQPHIMEFDDARVRSDAFLARSLTEAGKPDEAFPHLTAARELLAAMEKASPGVPHLRHQAAANAEFEAMAWTAMKNWPRAVAAHREAVAILDPLLKADPKDDTARGELLSERQLLAESLASSGQIPDARASMESALGMLREAAASRKLTAQEVKLQSDAEAKIASWK